MKDINQPALDLGLNEASTLLLKQMKRGRVTADQMAKTLKLRLGVADDPTQQQPSLSDCLEAMLQQAAE